MIEYHSIKEGVIMPKVSVIIPCHNTDKYIQTCLNSLIHQQLKDLEIICVDDHSTDNTLNILKQFEKEYPTKVKVLSLQAERGCSAARNLGLSYANGEYIGFVDSDDYVSLNMYLDFYYLARAYNVKIVSGKIEFILENQNELITNNNSPKKHFQLCHNKNILIFEPPSCCHRLFEHAFIENESFLVNKKYEDISFTIPLLIKANNLLAIKESCYFYRANPSGIMATDNHHNAKILDIFSEIKELRQRIENYDSQKEYQKIIKDLEQRFVFTVGNSILDWDISHAAKKYLISLYLTIADKQIAALWNSKNSFIKDLKSELEPYYCASFYQDEPLELQRKFTEFCRQYRLKR